MSGNKSLQEVMSVIYSEAMADKEISVCREFFSKDGATSQRNNIASAATIPVGILGLGSSLQDIDKCLVVEAREKLPIGGD